MATSAAASSSPTAMRWALARRLRELRLEAGRSVEDVSAELMCSPAKISRLETGGRGINPRDVRDLSRYYGVSPAVQAELLRMAAEAGKRGWWQGFRTLHDEASQFIGLESAAVETRAFHPTVIPGQLQTVEYTLALLSRVQPAAEQSEEAHAEWAQARQRRKDRILDGSLRMSAIVQEEALARPVGEPGVTLRQLDHIIQLAELSNVTLQVIPLVNGAHPGMDGNFEWLHFAPDTVADVVFVEGHLGMFLVDRPAETERYRKMYDDLAVRVALDAESSVVWLDGFRSRLAA
jgi:transcriptional regulator with XRE-family HTH domain